MRDYTRFDERLDRLNRDVYAQPPDGGHTAWAEAALAWLLEKVYPGMGRPVGRVLDVGCGQGFMCERFEQAGLGWTGVAIGEDVLRAQSHLAETGRSTDKVQEADMSFLPFEGASFDLVFARHVLEHSPFPILTLMEWRRMVQFGGWLCLIAPAPHYWKYRGRNHYSVAPKELLKWWLMRGGWNPIHEVTFDNRDPLFLKHLEVYQNAIAGGRDPGNEKVEKVLAPYPPGPVEFRFLCRAEAEILE